MTELSSLPPLPPKVAAALNKVMAGVQRLDRDDKNPFANYRYAGIEAFLEMVRPLCADAGLLILQDEESYEFVHTKDSKDKDIAWLVMSFLFGLAHSSGETWSHRIRRTGMVQASMGSQAFGAAQSYALKQFLRSVGLITTGDSEDADSHQPRNLPTRRRGAAQAGLDQPTLSKEMSKHSYDVLVKELRSFTAESDLTAWGLESVDRIYAMHPDFVQYLHNDYKDHLVAIREGVTEDGKKLNGAADAPSEDEKVSRETLTPEAQDTLAAIGEAKRPDDNVEKLGVKQRLKASLKKERT